MPGPTVSFADRRIEYAIVTTVLTVFFAMFFALTWYLCQHFWPFARTFSRLPLHEKADWCSRANSQLHALVLCPALIATLSMTRWDSDYDAISPHVENVRYILCMSAAYFTFDLAVIIAFRVPLWYVFVGHHVFAMIPIFFQIFRRDCQSGTYILAMFLLVEFANIFFNLQSWAETFGKGKETCFNAIWFHSAYVAWFLSRIIIPFYCLIEWWRFVIFSPRGSGLSMTMDCLVLESISGHLILLFCSVVFCAVLTPEMVKRIKGVYVAEAEERRKAAAEASKNEPTTNSAAGDAEAPSPEMGESREEESPTSPLKRIESNLYRT